ncbi:MULTISPECIES: aminoglycoside phosphotransferase family protein [Halorussus]|uniref:aminoglycoside phosphotransferase family protein n=1 Tax=Halorussus TaxID=1070314 RepID=UPI00209F0303|nr:aminoglycoside phosphotransferase family protein [Halorussus vallis]USZ73939.1 aminoglycoside phosphotransferase family protein [Halorussus vallis]
MTTANRDVHGALASISDEYEVVRRLHAVPPHAVYEVTIDGTRAVCKVARGQRADPAAEARVIARIGRTTSVPVPEVLAVGEDWFVAEWRDGLPGEATADAERARVMGAGLATLHAETAGSFAATGFPRDAGDALAVDARDSWHETVCDLLADRRDYLAAFGYSEVADAALTFVRERPDLLDGAGDPVLTHGNYLPEHVAAEDGEVTCVVDWEHALVAPGEYDYWRTALPLQSEAEPTERDAVLAAFREGYESVRPLPEGFERRGEIYRLINAVSYLKALHLQRQQTGQEKARTAAAFREYVYDTV